jgi:hypothetical protein
MMAIPALTPDEIKQDRVAGIMREIVRQGYALSMADSNRWG